VTYHACILLGFVRRIVRKKLEKIVREIIRKKFRKIVRRNSSKNS
jgi:hypothetical protein